MSKKHICILVPETHWDREWYLTFQQFRIRLVRLTDKLLHILDSDPEYKSFTFDGQTIVLEDYLQIRPQEREHIKKLIQDERLLVGPWYVLPDEYLTSAEATVRNLMIGHKIAGEFGRVMKAGYIPDPFGHHAQMPQILSGFGIDNIIFTRGLGDEADTLNTEFWWEGADGTTILAINQPHSYGNATNLGGEGWGTTTENVNMDLALEQVKKEVEFLSKKASTKYLLLNNGSDHIEPQPALAKIIKYLNEHLDDTEVVHGTYEDYVRAVMAAKPKLKKFVGEMHRGKYWPLLLGVFSARMYIKQANERTQSLLEKWAEPASAFAWMLGGKYEDQFLWEAWKLCIQNHPHDSICGCSIDQVHKEMMPRFEQSQQIGEELTKESLQFIANKVDTSREDAPEGAKALVVFNPHAWDVTDTVKVHIEEPVQAGEMVPRYVVKDANGVPVPTHYSNDFILESDRRRSKWTGDISFTGKDIPALGYKTYYLERGEATMPSSLKVDTGHLENDFVKLNVRSNGTFDLYHKTTRTAYYNLNLFEDTEDTGDEYNYGSAYNTRTITSEGVSGTLSVVERGPGIGKLRADLVLHLPESLSNDRMSRSERTVACPVIVYITLHADLPRVDVLTVFHNNVKDHRLRVHFPTGIMAGTCFAEGQYNVVQRDPGIPNGAEWMEKPVGQKPVQSFVAIDGRDAGIAVINRGLPEYEVLRDEQCTVAQTLLRCVGWLSRDDYKQRPYQAGPTIPTPEAQCLGKHIFRYAVLPYQAEWKKSKVWQLAHQFNARTRAVEVGIQKGELPKAQSFVNVGPSNIIVTAVKKAENSDGLIIRVLNTTPDAVEATLSIGRQFRGAKLTNLNEEPIDAKATVEGNCVKLAMPGFKVQTVLFEF